MEDQRLIRVEDKIDKLVDKIGNIDSTLAAQHMSLEDHIRRTQLLENKVEPIQRHVAMIQGALKLIGLIALGAGIIEGVVALLEYLR